MKALNVRETVLASKTCLKSREIRWDLHNVIVEDAYLAKGCEALLSVCVLHCGGE